MIITQRMLDRFIVGAIVVILFKIPLFFALSLVGVRSPAVYTGLNALMAPVIAAVLITKVISQRRTFGFTLVALPFLIYTIREFTYGAPPVFLIKGFLFDFGLLIAVVSGVAFSHETYAKGFRIVSISNAVAIIVLFCLWPILGNPYSQFLAAYQMLDSLAFRNGIVSVNGLFGAGQVAGTFAVIGAFAFWTWHERGWATTCFIAGLLTTAKSALFMILIGGLLMIVFGQGSPKRRALLVVASFTLFGAAYLGYRAVIGVSAEEAQVSYTLAAATSALSIGDSPWIGHGFGINGDDPATRVYAKKAPIFDRSMAVSMGRTDWFEFAFLHPWIKHGVFFFLFYYVLLIVRRRYVDGRNRVVYWLLAVSNFHYPVVTIYTAFFLFSLAARPLRYQMVQHSRVVDLYGAPSYA